MPIRVAIADDHPSAREGLRGFLHEAGDARVVAEAADGAELLRLLGDLDPPPDVALVDAMMPGVDGIATAARIRALHPNVRVVVMSAFEDRDLVRAAVAAGALGYVLKSEDPEQILLTIRLVLGGTLVIPGGEGGGIIGWEGSARGDQDAAEDLTERDQQILRLLPGRTNRQIAESLAISPETVKAHLERIFTKLGVADRTAAAAEAIRQGLIA